MIEDTNVSETHIKETILPALDQGADVIVLGCTHYHWIKIMIQSIAKDRAAILEPSDAIAQRVARLLHDQ